MKQALRVIVQNAAKYSDAGTSISFGVTPDAGAGTIDISVEDEGIGMNQKSAAHAFNGSTAPTTHAMPARRARVWGSPSPSGSSTANGGVIGVTSVEGVGSRFTIRLPR